MTAPVRAFAIRSGAAGDLPRLVEIEDGAFAGDRLSRRALARHLQSPTAVLLVAAAPPDRAVAYALLLFRAGARRARLYSLAVDPEARGGGGGGARAAPGPARAPRRRAG
ncbi:MAG: ribosomal-protein-alanine acetyltransferase, partial [Aestuariivirgaceae bacterium]